LILLPGIVVALSGCSGNKPFEETRDNLLKAYNGESTVSVKYRQYAEIAGKEGYPRIQLLLNALSRSEEIHAGNHRATLASMGVNVSGPEIEGFAAGTTPENLRNAIRGEQWEVDTMYAGFIASAENEKAKDAVEVFTWARDTEKKHAAFLKSALKSIEDSASASLPSYWFICRKCGNTFAGGTETDPCPFCETPASEFEKFEDR
jgi:rubrerythrin